MLWRFYSDKEIKRLLSDYNLNLLQLLIPENSDGARHVYAEKPLDG